MKRSKLFALLIGICLVLVLVALPFMSACTPTEPGEQEEEEEEEEEVKYIKIGLLGSWTGSYAPHGVPHRESVLASVDWYNGPKSEFAPGGGFIVDGQKYMIELVEYDDRTDTKRAALGETYLIEQHDIKMIIGPFSSPCTLAAQPIGELSQTLNTTWSVADDSTRPEMTYTFSHAVLGKVMGLTESSFHDQVLQAETVAIVTENQAYNLSVRKALVENWEKLGIEVVSDDVFEKTVKDFSTVIARARKENPDLLYLNADGITDILILKQIAEADWKVQIAGETGLTSDDIYSTCGPAANELLCGAGLSYWAFVEGRVPQAMMDKMGSNMDLIIEQGDFFIEKWGNAHMGRMFYGWNGFRGYINAMQKAGTVDNGSAIRDAYEGSTWKDAQKTFRVLPNHRTEYYSPMIVYYESEKADKFDMLGVAYHTDDDQNNWVWEMYIPYPTIEEIREERGY